MTENWHVYAEDSDGADANFDNEENARELFEAWKKEHTGVHLHYEIFDEDGEILREDCIESTKGRVDE